MKTKKLKDKLLLESELTGLLESLNKTLRPLNAQFECDEQRSGANVLLQNCRVQYGDEVEFRNPFAVERDPRRTNAQDDLKNICAACVRSGFEFDDDYK